MQGRRALVLPSTRGRVFLCTMLLLLTWGIMAYAAGTPAGTQIRNKATVQYNDANGNPRPPIDSNEVITVVSQVYGVDVSPPQGGETIVAGNTADYGVIITNTGNGPDNINVQVVGPTVGPAATWSFSVYPDFDRDGILDSNERTSGPVSTTGVLPADGPFYAVLAVDVPSTANNGDIHTATITGTSQGDITKKDSAIFTTQASKAQVTLTKTVDRQQASPDQVLTYTLNISNSGGSSAINSVIEDQVPTSTAFVPGSATFTQGSGAVSVIGNTIRWTVGTLNPPISAQVRFQVRTNSGLTAGQTIINQGFARYEQPQGVNQPQVASNQVTTTIVISAAIDLDPDNSFTTDPGATVLCPFGVTNLGNGPDTIDLSFQSSLGYSWTLYSDQDRDGQIDTGVDFPLTNTGGGGAVDTGVVAAGQTVGIIGKTTVPSTATDQSQDVTTYTGRSTVDGNQTDAVRCTITVRAPSMTLTKQVVPQGDQPPGAVLTYVIGYRNNGTGDATNVQIRDTVPAETNYVTNSVFINGVRVNDNTQVGNTQVAVTGNLISVQLGPVPSNTGGQITFQVKIN